MHHAGVQEQDNYGEQHFCLSSFFFPSCPPPFLSLLFFFHLPLIQLDCGIHPGLSGMDALPYTDMIEADEIDLLLITQ